MSQNKFFGGVALSALSLLAPAALAQQTTGSIRGSVTDASGAPVSDLTIVITHEPTGTVSTASTNDAGIFLTSGLRPGGPYSVEVSGDAIQSQRIEDVFVTLAEPFALNIVTETTTVSSDIITVTASRLRNSGTLSTGASSRYNSEDIANTVSIGRDLKDVFAKDPLVSIDPSNSNAFSFAGANSRFNSITVDGIRQNDDFGLNNNGYPTQRSPISLDAIEVVEARIAPYGVQYDGFFGGNVNVVTKSGTNEFHGSAFYEYNDQSLRGTRVKNRKTSYTFDEKTYGVSLGGPILKDTLFFFANYEKFQGQNPISTGPTGGGFANSVPGITTDLVDTFRADTQRVYGFDPGATPNTVDIEDEKLLAKIDWNITEGHRASFSYQKTEGNSFNTGTSASTSSSSPAVVLNTRNYNKTEVLTQYRGELLSDWTDSFSTEVRVGFKNTETTQIPFGGLGFGQVNVTLAGMPGAPSGGVIRYGPDTFRHDNYLNVDTFTYDVRGQYQFGRHTLLAGFGSDAYEFVNVFVPNSLGTYNFSTYTDYLAKRANTYSLAGGLTAEQVAAGVAVPATFGTARAGAAEFAYSVFNAYVQDTFEFSDQLTLQGGLRYVRYSTDDQPTENANFKSRHGFSNTATMDGRDAILPRFSFVYDYTDDLRISGGVGKYTGGTLNVWVSNNYSNTGVSQTNAACPTGPYTITALNAVPAGCTFTPGNGDVNALDPDFEIPTSWKSNLSAEYFTLEDKSLRLFADYYYTVVDQGVLWRDLRVVQARTAPDGRPIYTTSTTGTTGANRYDLLLTNTDKGDSQAVTVGFDKTWDSLGLDLTMSYTYTDSNDANPATSSVALSNYENVANSDNNNLALATSDYEIEESFKMNLTWTGEVFGDNKTVVSLFGTHRSGLPYSYTYRNTASGNRDTVFGHFTDNRNFSNQLFYVPNADEVAVSGSAGAASAKVLLDGITVDQLNAYIADQGLEGYRGQITPRNGFNTDDFTKFDLHISQEVPAFFPEAAKLKAYMDIENLGNLLNEDWGVLEQESFVRFREVSNVTINSSGQYVYSSLQANPLPNIFIDQSTWRVKFGLRYEF